MTAISALPAPQVLAAHLGDESVLLDLDTKHYFQLNATASAIWRALEDRQPVEHIVAALVTDFDVSAPEAREAVGRLVQDMRRKGLVTEPDAA